MATPSDPKKNAPATSRATAKPRGSAAAAGPASTKKTPARSSTKAPAKPAVNSMPKPKMPAASKAAPRPKATKVPKIASVPDVGSVAAVTENAVLATSSASETIGTVLASSATPSTAQTPANETLAISLSSDPADLSDIEDFAVDAVADNAPGLTDENEDTSAEDDSDFDEMRVQLMALQQKIRAAKIPVVIVFEGWDASGKGTLLSKLIEGLDPRGYQVYPMRKPTEHDCLYPHMRRYWVHMPAAGNISLFCSSWYREVSKECFESKIARKRLNQNYQEIVSLESQLVTDGVLLIKFFLHIPRKEQKRRLKALESKKSTRWRVEKEDWYQNEHYEEYLRLYDEMIARTHFEGAQWHVLHSDDKRLSLRQMYSTVIEAFQAALRDREANLRSWDTPFLPHLENTPTVTFPPLETFDPEQALTDPYKPAIDAAQKRLRKLQNTLYRSGTSMVVCFEGWDAAGKGGAIRRLTSSLDARGFDVVPISSPTPLELSHHYLWRFWRELPQNGHIAIFDRTWYGRVMVERVEGFCTETQWQRAYEEINRFESEIVNHGSILCKFWLQIDRDTQLARFNDREASPDKQWKITEEDWRNREKWPQYEEAVGDMLQKTNTAYAPWTVVEANNKQFARLKVLETVIHAVEKQLGCEEE